MKLIPQPLLRSKINERSDMIMTDNITRNHIYNSSYYATQLSHVLEQTVEDPIKLY
jgi:hypothetical protein